MEGGEERGGEGAGRRLGGKQRREGLAGEWGKHETAVEGRMVEDSRSSGSGVGQAGKKGAE